VSMLQNGTGSGTWSNWCFGLNHFGLLQKLQIKYYIHTRTIKSYLQNNDIYNRYVCISSINW
jgi:hypothetical protein